MYHAVSSKILYYLPLCNSILFCLIFILFCNLFFSKQLTLQIFDGIIVMYSQCNKRSTTIKKHFIKRNMEKKYFKENVNALLLDKSNVTTQFLINQTVFRPIHSHEDYWEFSVVMKGTIYNHINGKIFACTPGTMFYCTTKDVHNLTSNDKYVRYVNFTVALPTILQLLAPLSAHTVNKLYNNNRMYTLPSEIFSTVNSTLHTLNLIPPEQYEQSNDIIVSQIMSFLQFIIIRSQTEDNDNEPAWIQNLNEMKRNEDFFTYTVADLCHRLNYSRMQLSRLFKQNFGSTPHDYLLANRLLYAQNLLDNTDLSTIAIANAVGYSNLAQFNIVFKNKFGVTPGQYRK